MGRPRKLCIPEWRNIREYRRNRYKWQVEHEICTRCGKVLDNPFGVNCLACRAKVNAYSRARRMADKTR